MSILIAVKCNEWPGDDLAAEERERLERECVERAVARGDWDWAEDCRTDLME